MSVSHKNLDNSNIHLPKDFSTAANSTVLSKDANGNLEWVSKDDVGGSQGPQGEQGPAASIQNIVTVQTDPQPGQYALISTAIASITDASSTNPYYINVGPGVYTESATIVMKPWVYVRGTGKTTRIFFNFSDNHGIRGADYSSIENCFVSYNDMSAEGFAAIYHTNTVSGSGNRNFVVKNIHMGYAFNGVMVEGTSYATQINVFDFSYGSNYSCHYLFRLIGNGSATCRIIAESLRPIQVATPRPYALIHASGNVEFVASNFLANSGGNALSGHTYGPTVPEVGTPSPATLGKYGIYAENGATVRIIGGTLRGWETGIFAANVGSAPKIDIQGLYADRNTLSINIEHPDTSGAIFCQAEGSKVMLDPNATDLTLLVSDIETGSQGIINLGKLRIAPGGDYSGLYDLGYLSKYGAVAGCYDGGMISVNSGLTINVTAGRGYFFDTGADVLREVIWGAKTGQAITANSDVYLIVNEDGDVVETASISKTENVILLGRVVTAASSIRFIENLPSQGIHSTNKIYDFHRATFGCVYESGSTVAENGSVAYNLDVGNGVRWFMGNKVLTAGGSQITFTQIYQNGSGGWTETTLQTVNSTQYESAPGTLSALSATYFRNAYLYVVGSSADSTEKYYLQLGQAQYATLLAAQEEAIPTPPTWLKDGAVAIARITIQQGGASITAVGDITSLKPTLGGAAAVSGGGGGSSDHGSLLGLNDDDHIQYLLASGSRSMSGSLNMGTNNITNVGLVDGVDVSAHASRHLPNGADPLSTAAASTITGSGANAEGTANTFARADHKHAIQLSYLGATTFNLQELQNLNHSTGVLTGLTITANGGTPTNIDIAAGTLFVRAGTANSDILYFYAYAGTTNQALTANSNNYVYIDYNAGSPALTITTTQSTDYHTKCYLGKVYYDAVAPTLHIASHERVQVADHAALMIRRLTESAPYAKVSGATITEVGTRNLAVSAGVFWHALNRITSSSLNTQTGDTFDYYYNRSAWTYASGATQIGNSTYDNAGTLTAMTASYYRIDEIYIEPGDNHLIVIRGNAEYATLSEAKAQTTLMDSQLPDQLRGHATLLGRVIIQQGASTYSLLLNRGVDTLVTPLTSVDLSYHLVTATADDTITSASYVQINSMTVTPASGLWDISFSSSANTSTNAADAEYTIYVGGVQVTHTERNLNFNGGASFTGADTGLHTQHIATLNGAQAVAVYARVNSGNLIIHERSLKLVKIGN